MNRGRERVQKWPQTGWVFLNPYLEKKEQERETLPGHLGSRKVRIEGAAGVGGCVCEASPEPPPHGQRVWMMGFVYGIPGTTQGHKPRGWARDVRLTHK